MDRLGFDVLDHLQSMRSKGLRSINIQEYARASSAAVRVWEDSNYPYKKDALFDH